MSCRKLLLDPNQDVCVRACVCPHNAHLSPPYTRSQEKNKLEINWSTNEEWVV